MLGPPFFSLDDVTQQDRLNQYRINYQAFRLGNSKGSKGEIAEAVQKAQVSSVVPPFLAKLYDIMENNLFSEFITWSSDGNTVVVKKVGLSYIFHAWFHCSTAYRIFTHSFAEIFQAQ